MTTPFDLMVAPTGARLSRADHSAVPLATDEIVKTAVACRAVGASALHLHVRDDQGKHSIDPARYARTMAAISAASDIHIQVSTEAAGVFDVAAQRDCLAEVPATDASVSLRELARDPAKRAEAYAMATARGISMQHILYDATEVKELLHLFDTAQIPEQSRRAIFVLGRYTKDQQSAPHDLDPFIAALGQDDLHWSACAFGKAEHACLLAALRAGGQARIGFENNRLAPDGTLYPDNQTSVAAFVSAAENAGFTPR